MVKRNKYGAVKTVINGIKFDSKAEAEYYLYLLEKIDSGADLELVELQPKVYLTETRILYKPDFLIREGDSVYYVDIKGMTTPVFNIKARLWKNYGAGELRLIRKKGRGWDTFKTIYTVGNK